MHEQELIKIVAQAQARLRKSKEVDTAIGGNWDKSDESYFAGYSDALDYVLDVLYNQVYGDDDLCVQCGEHIADAHQPTCKFSDEKVEDEKHSRYPVNSTQWYCTTHNAFEVRELV